MQASLSNNDNKNEVSSKSAQAVLLSALQQTPEARLACKPDRSRVVLVAAAADRARSQDRFSLEFSRNLAESRLARLARSMPRRADAAWKRVSDPPLSRTRSDHYASARARLGVSLFAWSRISFRSDIHVGRGRGDIAENESHAACARDAGTDSRRSTVNLARRAGRGLINRRGSARYRVSRDSICLTQAAPSSTPRGECTRAISGRADARAFGSMSRESITRSRQSREVKGRPRYDYAHLAVVNRAILHN